MNDYARTKENAEFWCNMHGWMFRGFDNLSVYFSGYLEDGTISNGGQIWFGVENELRDRIIDLRERGADIIDSHTDLGVKCFAADPEFSEMRMKEWIEIKTYRATKCGASVRFYENGVEFGCAIEGSDAEVSTDPLIYPFAKEEVDKTLDYIEYEAAQLWRDANDPEEEEVG